MPVWKAEEEPRTVRHGDICTSFTERANVLGHALLCERETEWSLTNRSVRSVHMGPPLLQTPMEVDSVGSVPLDAAEQKQVSLFVKQRWQQRTAKQQRKYIDGVDLDYVINPHFLRPSRDNAGWRFNCVGFVVAAYSFAGIELVSTDLPRVGMDALLLAYPSVAEMTEAAKEAMGIGEGNAWPIVFVGYVMASLERSPDEIRQTPYLPSIDDIYFSPTAND